MDFSWGFQSLRPSGTFSRTRRLEAASRSSSPVSHSVIFIATSPLNFLNFWLGQDLVTATMLSHHCEAFRRVLTLAQPWASRRLLCCLRPANSNFPRLTAHFRLAPFTDLEVLMSPKS